MLPRLLMSLTLIAPLALCRAARCAALLARNDTLPLFHTRCRRLFRCHLMPLTPLRADAAIHIAYFRPPCRDYVARCAMMLAPTMIFAASADAALCCRAMPLIAIFEAFDIADYAISYIDVRMPFLPMMRAAITPFSLMPPCRHYCCH
jgi:hypothetical protein